MTEKKRISTFLKFFIGLIVGYFGALLIDKFFSLPF